MADDAEHLSIRPALPSDRDAIAEFTRETFEWGDYVAEVFDNWLDRDEVRVIVATDPDGRPVATATVELLSSSEAWFSAARVDPDHRGRGIAAEIARALRAWARERGAVVGRLLVEDWNEVSIRHVERTGLRRVASVLRCTKPVGDASPSPGGNGGQRLPSPLRARPAGSSESQPAFASWSVGRLGRASRGLYAAGWSFRRLTPLDLERAARGNTFWEIGAGWALAEPSTEGRLEVGWLEAREEDMGDLMRSLIDLAIGSGSETIVVWVPFLEWTEQAARRLGFETSLLHVYATDL